MATEIRTGIRLTGDASGMNSAFAGGEKAVKSLNREVADASKRLGDHIQVVDKYVMSEKAMASALRGVPAQFTDIFTSLSAGQAPMQVLLQQGGQLKDMFGGAGPAAKALGGYVLGLVNPFTLGAAAVGALGYAYYKGSEEASAYTQSIVISGNAAGVVSAQLQEAARNIGNTGQATQSAAADALAQFVADGQVSSENLEKFTSVSLAMNKRLSMSVEDTVKQFSELGKAPVDASVKLNEKYHYLTASVYEQIKALKEQGEQDRAGELAQAAFADAFAVRAKRVAENLGTLESAWGSVKRGAAAAWDSMLNVGRESDPRASLEKAIAVREGFVRNKNTGAIPQDDEMLNDLKQRLSYLTEEERLQKRGAEASAEQNRLATAQIDLDKEHDKYLTKALKLKNELAAATAKAAAAPQTPANDKKLQETLAGIREKYEEKGPKERKITIKSDAWSTDVARSYAKVMDDLGRVQGAASSKADDLSKSQAKLRDVMASPEFAAYSRQQKEQVIYAASLAQAEEDRLAGDVLSNEASAERRAANLRAYDEAQRLELESRALRIGAIKDPQAQARAQLDAELRDRKDAMLAGVTSPDARQQATERFNEYAILKNEELAEKMKPGWQRLVEGWSDTSRLMRDTFNDTMDGVVRAGEDAFVQFAKTGKLSVRSLVDVVIAEMARMQYRQNIAGPLSSLLSSGLSALFGVDTTQLATGDFVRMDRLTAVNHSGGIAGMADAAFRPVDRAVFAGAPRFHTGGIAGNEVPIIAQRGEGIFTREQMAALAPAGAGQQPVTVNVINQAGSRVDVQQQQTPSGLQIDVLITQLQDAMADNLSAGSGSLARAMEGRFGLRTAVA